jgi:hypothetical protein
VLIRLWLQQRQPSLLLHFECSCNEEKKKKSDEMANARIKPEGGAQIPQHKARFDVEDQLLMR